MAFIPGLELAQRFYEECVQPIMARDFPDVRYSAGLVGTGSEVLGFDTPQSTDHHWGPRALLFLSESDLPRYADAIRDHFRHHLPHRFLGYPTSFLEHASDPGTMMLDARDSGPVDHRVEVYTPRGFFEMHLGLDPSQELTPLDWLTLPQQQLLNVTAGRVFHDGLGEMESLRAKFAYYPHDVWLYLLAGQWSRIAQEEAFMGRTGAIGDEIGSQIIGGRLARDVMRLCFLMEQQYAPYIKWFGTGFSRLGIAPTLMPLLDKTLHAADWHQREWYLSAIYSVVADQHNQLKLTDPLPTEVSPYWSRPYQVIHANHFAEAIFERIQDPAIRALPPSIGGADQISDNTDVLAAPPRFRKLAALYQD